MTQPKIALVEWLDATRTDDTVVASDRIGTVRETVGWLLRNDREGVIVAMTRDGGEAFERGFTIPKRYVVSVTVLHP